MDKLFRIYWWPLVTVVAIIEIGVGIIKYYFYHSNLIGQEPLLQVEAIVTFLATFAGIFVPLQITRNLKKEADRRTLAFTLGILWTELRNNKNVLKQIEKNYQFSKMLNELQNFNDLIKMLLGKYQFIHVTTNELQDKSFVASQSSGAITTFDKDDVFNDVSIAYENLNIFIITSLITLEALRMKEYLIENSPDSLSPAEESLFVDEIESCLKRGYEELLFCLRMTDKAISSVDTRLNELGVVSSKEIRNLESIEKIP